MDFPTVLHPRATYTAIVRRTWQHRHQRGWQRGAAAGVSVMVSTICDAVGEIITPEAHLPATGAFEGLDLPTGARIRFRATRRTVTYGTTTRHDFLRIANVTVDKP